MKDKVWRISTIERKDRTYAALVTRNNPAEFEPYIHLYGKVSSWSVLRIQRQVKLHDAHFQYQNISDSGVITAYMFDLIPQPKGVRYDDI